MKKNQTMILLICNIYFKHFNQLLIINAYLTTKKSKRFLSSFKFLVSFRFYFQRLREYFYVFFKVLLAYTYIQRDLNKFFFF